MATTTFNFEFDASRQGHWRKQANPLGAVDLDDGDSVETAINAILNRLDRQGYDAALLENAIQDVVKAYAGSCPGLLSSGALQHDLRHALAADPSAARRLDGDPQPAATPAREQRMVGQQVLLCVLLALVHDMVSLRGDAEIDRWGPD